MENNLTLKPTVDFPLAEIATGLNRGFEGYIVDVRVNASHLAQLIRCESIDLTMSQMIFADDALVGCALIGRRGWTSRVAALGIDPARRGQGIGRWAMDELIAQAKERQDKDMVLEVIAQNTPAVKLYQNLNFEADGRLIGFGEHTPTGVPDPDLREVGVAEVGRMLIQYGPPNLPWQIAGETLINYGPPLQAYKLGPAYMVISDPTRPQIGVRSLFSVDETAEEAMARLFKAVIAKYPDKIWQASAIFPEQMIASPFEALGFTQHSISQWQMTLNLT